MLTARGIRNACPKHAVTAHILPRLGASQNVPLNRISCASTIQSRRQTKLFSTTTHRAFATSRSLLQSEGTVAPKATEAEVEQIVRDAKQRFRDTLPKDYLNEEEYALYVRLYGPPLRETSPEDVGIDTHIDLPPDLANLGRDGIVLKPMPDGSFKEIAFDLPSKPVEPIEEDIIDESEPVSEEDAVAPEDVVDAASQSTSQGAPGYVDTVARSQREADAMHRLARDFEAAQKARADAEALAEEEAAEEAVEQMEEVEETEWPEERESGMMMLKTGEERKYHPYTTEGSFHGKPIEITLPQEELVKPISELLKRSHFKHVLAAAEKAYGGGGIPLAPEFVLGRRSGHMGGMPMLADKTHMTEVEADAFLAAFFSPAYASIYSALRETRKRNGSDWIQSKLRKGGEGLSVLDAGSGGAGLLAWEQILNAEWELLKEKGQARGAAPPGKKTVIVSSDRLRHRLKNVLHNTTFLPRMPDYEHSGEMRGPRLQGGETPQAQKQYDVIIASHLLLREKEPHRRQAALNNLWHLLKKDGGVLVIVEKAHPRGFEALAHARHNILNQFLLDEDGNPRIPPEEFNSTYHRTPEPGHIIAPCTTQGACPMYPEPGQSVGRKDYCYFSQRFVRPAFYTRMLRKKYDHQGEVEFSYVAVQRGVSRAGKVRGDEAAALAKQGYEDSKDAPDMQTLPRILLPSLKRKGHVTMDVCTPAGKVERWTVTKSFSKQAYHDARKSHWGDLWALGAKTTVPRNPRVGVVDDGGQRARDAKRKGDKEEPEKRSKQKAKDKKARVKELAKDQLVKLHSKAAMMEEDIDMDRILDQEIEEDLEEIRANERQEQEASRRAERATRRDSRTDTKDNSG